MWYILHSLITLSRTSELKELFKHIFLKIHPKIPGLTLQGHRLWSMLKKFFKNPWFWPVPCSILKPYSVLKTVLPCCWLYLSNNAYFLLLKPWWVMSPVDIIKSKSYLICNYFIHNSWIIEKVYQERSSLTVEEKVNINYT